MTLYKVLLCVVFLILPFFKSTSDRSNDHGHNILDKVFEATLEDIIRDENVEEGRFFNYDQRNAFNSAVAFTCPLTILYTTRQKTSLTGEPVPNQYASYGYPVMFIIAGALWSTFSFQQGPNYGALNEALYRSSDNNFFNNELINKFYNSLQKVSEVLDIESCAKLAICESHAKPEKYGNLARLMHLLFPADVQKRGNELSDYAKAANYGYKGADECYYEYQCLLQPLDVVLYIKNYLWGFLREDY